jgi:hypothetical protein
MARKSEPHQPSLFKEKTLVKPCLNRRVDIAGIVKSQLREVAATPVNVRGESMHEQDHR